MHDCVEYSRMKRNELENYLSVGLFSFRSFEKFSLKKCAQFLIRTESRFSRTHAFDKIDL